jgi:outer membrane protein OmpA-like peptidoglycan-associated protein
MQGFKALCVWVISGIILLLGCKTSHSVQETVIDADAVVAEKMHEQQQELEAILPEGTIIESVDNGEALKITFSSGILFAANSNTISESSKSMLRDFAGNLNNNPDTNISITGHTDNTGNAGYNQTLSERRAKSVYDFLSEQGVNPMCMNYSGKGIHEPVADNNTVEGRALNRRVEVIVF